MLRRVALTMAAVMATATALVGTGTAAHAATGDTWSGFQVVDVQPAATTQAVVLGLMPHYTGGGQDLYLWDSVEMVKDHNGRESWVFCIQEAQGGSAPSYTEDPSQAGTPSARANATKINRVLADAKLAAPGDLQVTPPDPALASPSDYVLPQNKKDHLEMTAVQMAIWHFSDGFDFTTSNTSIAKQFYPASHAGDGDQVTMADVIARYDTLVADAVANPLTNPSPKVHVSPSAQSADTGTALFYDVTGTDIDGGITLSTDSAAVEAHPVNGGSCDTGTVLTSLPDSGGKVCMVSADPATVHLTATGSSAPTTTHPLYAYGTQGLIGTGPDHASCTAKGTWTTPPKPTHGLSLTKTNDPTRETTSSFGDTITYHLTATATGNATEHAVVVTDDVPGYGSNSGSSPTTYVDGSATCVAPPAPDASNCAVTTTTTAGKVTSISWAIGDLASGSSRTVTFKVTIDVVKTTAGSVLVTNAGAVSSTCTPKTPSNPVENPVRIVSGLRIVKSNSPTGTVEVGDTITYKLAVSVPSNVSFDQDDVVVTDYVPGYDPTLPTSATATYVDHSATCTGTILPTVGRCDVTLTKNSAGKVVKITWALGSMKAGQTTNAVFKVTADDPGTTTGTVHLDNVAVVRSAYTPTTPSNKVTNPLTPPVEVLGTKTPAPPTASALAHTGADVTDEAAAGLWFLVLGVCMVAATRRRRGLDPR